ncbi:MAG: hypothetical protein H6R15_1707 [Proteobacteria bacterium]|nr:hypothetical protein [Pseudomonadota bacterium]
MVYTNKFETTLAAIESNIKAAGALLASALIASGGACYLSATLLIV